MHHPRRSRPLFWTALLSLVAAAPTTAPSTRPADTSPHQTGELTLTFTQRSPLSSRKEIARRLSYKESDLQEYDLATFTFRVYVPPNYDPKTSYGLFVYLGNHDVPSVPTKWEPVFDKSHMIFVGPDWHSPMQDWQLIGLGFDAIDNLKRAYNIDTRRLYDMWFGTESLEMPLAGADVYTGMIFGRQWKYFHRINLSNNTYVPAEIQPPRPDLLQRAKQHGVVLISLNDESPASAAAIATGLKQDGFTHVLNITQTFDEVHYPNYAANWITDPVLPFLDKAAAQGPDVPASRPAGKIASGNSDADHLLSMAHLFINNGNTEMARTKLQALIAAYPHDPAAISAKKLLDSLPPPPSPQ